MCCYALCAPGVQEARGYVVSMQCHRLAQHSCAVVQDMGQKQLTEDNLKKVDGLRPIAEELGCSLAQLALAWAASNPDVSTVITGATKPQQARAMRHEDCSYHPLALLHPARKPSVHRTAARMDLQLPCKH